MKINGTTSVNETPVYGKLPPQQVATISSHRKQAAFMRVTTPNIVVSLMRSFSPLRARTHTKLSTQLSIIGVYLVTYMKFHM